MFVRYKEDNFPVTPEQLAKFDLEDGQEIDLYQLIDLQADNKKSRVAAGVIYPDDEELPG